MCSWRPGSPGFDERFDAPRAPEEDSSILPNHRRQFLTWHISSVGPSGPRVCRSTIEDDSSAPLASFQGLPADLIQFLCTFLGPTMTLVCQRVCKRWYLVLRPGNAFVWKYFASRIPRERVTLCRDMTTPSPKTWAKSFVRRFRRGDLYLLPNGEFHMCIPRVPMELRRLKTARRKVLFYLSWLARYAEVYYESLDNKYASRMLVVFLSVLRQTCGHAFRMSEDFQRTATCRTWVGHLDPERTAACCQALRFCKSNSLLQETVSFGDFLA